MNMNRHALKAKLLHLMQRNNHQQAIEAVLNSGLLPSPQLRQWIDDLVERAVRRVLGHSGCPEWEAWAAKWLSGEDRTEEKARAARVAARVTEEEAEEEAEWTAWAAWVAAWVAEEARTAEAAEQAARAARVAWVAAWAAEETAAWVARAAERKAQYDDLLNLINDL